MFIAYCVLALVYSAMLTFSGISKLQPHPDAVKMIHEVIGVPMAMFPVLAVMEFAAAAGLLAGIRWARLGVAAAGGAMLYFIGAIVSHLLVGDFAGIGGAVFMLVLASALLALRIKSLDRPRTR